MSPELMARIVIRWARFYTRDLPAPVAARRVDEIRADLHDHVEAERAAGVADRRIALGIASRMLRGLDADAAWRTRHATRTDRAVYGIALAFAFGSMFMLYGLIGAVGVIGETGDRADMMYLAVFAIGILGALVARFRPRGMAVVLLAMALAQSLIAVIALVLGKHNDPVTSIPELLGVNAIFVVLFIAAAWLFRFSDARAT